MKNRNRYKYSYNTYQKNALLLIIFLLISGGAVGYYNYTNYSPEDEFDADVLQVSEEKIDRTIKDVNAELDNLLQQEAPLTYKDRKLIEYKNDYEQYKSNQENDKQGLEDYKKRAAIEQQLRLEAKIQREREEKERLRIQQEEEQQARLRNLQRLQEEQRQREYEEQQRQLQRLNNQNKIIIQEETKYIQEDKKEITTQAELEAELQRRQEERRIKLEEMQKKVYTPEQQKEIDECIRKEERRQSQLNRRRNAPVKSKHRSLQPEQPQQGPPEEGCEACARY